VNHFLYCHLPFEDRRLIGQLLFQLVLGKLGMYRLNYLKGFLRDLLKGFKLYQDKVKELDLLLHHLLTEDRKQIDQHLCRSVLGKLGMYRQSYLIGSMQDLGQSLALVLVMVLYLSFQLVHLQDFLNEVRQQMRSPIKGQ